MKIPRAILLIALVFGAGSANPGVAADKKSPPPFVVFATVFTTQGFLLPGAEARLRRAGEKKVRWQARSDRRGEFAIRVPQGEEYELTVSAKGYRTLTQRVDARETNRVDLTLHLETASNKKGEKAAPAKSLDNKQLESGPAPGKPAGEKPPKL